ncbi:hypothetical protein BH24ACT19_BH24ACT19_09360 [soil metagenome]
MGYVQLSVNAADSQTRGDFFGLVARQLAESSLPPPAQPNTDYFLQTRRVAAVHRQLVERAAAELDAKGVSEETKERVVVLLRTAQTLNKMAPQSRNQKVEAVRWVLRECKPEDVSNAVAALNKSLKESRLPRQSLQDRVKRDLFNVTADALLSDLTSTIVGDKRRGPLKSTQRPIEGVSRLLIWLDDYEALAPVLGDFLVESLVPRLAKAQFPTLLIVGCRDDLEATHPGWSQHAKRYLREQIRLTPFDKEAAYELLAEAGIAEERWAPIYEATQGLPFLLTLAIEEATVPGAESALFAKKFFERTTRWMSSKEREWFTAVCYLDTINEDTLKAVFREEDVPLVQDWFEREASIRDPASRLFQMRPLIREKVLRYLETRSPSRHREMLQKVKRFERDDTSS